MRPTQATIGVAHRCHYSPKEVWLPAVIAVRGLNPDLADGQVAAQGAANCQSRHGNAGLGSI